ncbi:reverse transcriptase [Trichonephila clavipes]|nr:reverse transcriptase [Trichonephila clavipes]
MVGNYNVQQIPKVWSIDLRGLMTTRKKFGGVHVHWIGLAADEACWFCGHVRMDGDHLLQCTGLDEYPTDDIVSWYWEALRRMKNRKVVSKNAIRSGLNNAGVSVSSRTIRRRLTDIRLRRRIP